MSRHLQKSNNPVQQSPTATPTSSPATNTTPPKAVQSSARNSTASDNSDHSNPTEFSVVVNKKHPLTPVDFIPPDLTSYNGFLLSSKVLADLQALLAASAANGTPIELSSSYRSYSNQVVTYNHWVTTNGSTAAADKVSARPGYSEHQTGFAFDFSFGGCYLDCFNNSPQYLWLRSNAVKYGFIERYPPGFESITGYSAESWHWRYVGPSTAAAIQAQGYSTLEEFWNVAGGDY